MNPIHRLAWCLLALAWCAFEPRLQARAWGSAPFALPGAALGALAGLALLAWLWRSSLGEPFIYFRF